MDFGVGIILLAWMFSGIPFAATCAYIAHHKGRSVFNWLLIGFFASFFALVAIACIPKIKSKINFETEKKKILYAIVAYASVAIATIATIVIMYNITKEREREQLLNKITCNIAEEYTSILTNYNIQVSECEASQQDKTINMWIDIAYRPAVKFCKEIAKEWVERGWRIRIYTPFSKDQVIATCTS